MCIYIYAYPAPRSSASNRLVIRSDRYDERSGNPSNCTLRSDGTVWRGKNAESETRHPRAGSAERLVPPSRRTIDRWYLPAYTRPTPRRAGRHPAAGPAPAARGTTHDNAARGRKERDTHTGPPAPSLPGSPSREAADNTIGCDERNDQTQCTPRTREERARGCSSTRPADSR